MAISAQLASAELNEATGHRAEAKQQLNQLIGFLHTRNEPNQEIHAQSLLAEIALREGNAVEATRAVESARKLIRPDQWLEERYVFGIADARVQAANGRLSSARQSLNSIIADSIRHDYVHYQLEARLALCEVEAGSDPNAARMHAKQLEQDARARGFALIARKATTVVDSSPSQPKS